MRVEIICPLYNAEKYIKGLHNNIMRQKADFDFKVSYVLTESVDNTQEILEDMKLNYCIVNKSEFSHSKTREFMGLKSESDIIVFISQDVEMKNEFWLCNLVNPIKQMECDASFSRQICQNESIEKYIREKNYPTVSRIISKSEVEKLGLMAFFYSDASSAIRTEVYKELNAYDGKDLIINEDMYLAHKIINNGYKIKYCSDSQVYHSHTFTLKQLFNRYFDTGVFFRMNPEFLNYKQNQSGITLLIYVFVHAFRERNIKVIFNIIPNFTARFMGSYFGKKYEVISNNRRITYSLNKKYWSKIEEVF